MYVKKVSSGEWKGFDKPKPQSHIRDDALKLEKLTGHITELSSDILQPLK
jgi:hypothetical protein